MKVMIYLPHTIHSITMYAIFLQSLPKTRIVLHWSRLGYWMSTLIIHCQWEDHVISSPLGESQVATIGTKTRCPWPQHTRMGVFYSPIAWPSHWQRMISAFYIPASYRAEVEHNSWNAFLPWQLFEPSTTWLTIQHTNHYTITTASAKQAHNHD